MKVARRNIRPARLYCDFIHDDAAYGTFWDITRQNGSGSNTNLVSGYGGCAVLSANNIGSGYEVTCTHKAAFSRALNPRIKAKLKLDTDLVNKEVYLGFSDSPLGDGGAEVDYCYFLFDYSADNVNWWASSGDGADVSCGAGPTADSFEEVEIMLRANGDAEFTFGDTIVATVTGAVGADTAMYLFIGISNETTGAESVHCSHIEVDWELE